MNFQNYSLDQVHRMYEEQYNPSSKDASTGSIVAIFGFNPKGDKSHKKAIM